MTTNTAPADDITLPILPKALLDAIGHYGFAHADKATDTDRLHRWELLIAAIKDYTRVQVRADRASPSRAAVPATMYVEVRECSECQHVDINGNSDTAACNRCDWSGPSPKEDHCPGCGEDGTMTSACTECGARSHLLASDSLPVAAAPLLPAAVDVGAAQAETAQAAPVVPGCDVGYAHFTPFYLLSNARRLLSAEYRRKPNYVIARELFAVGHTSASLICREAGIDPDGLEVRKAATPGATHGN